MPRLERVENLSSQMEYLLIRVDNEFAFETMQKNNPRTDNNIVLTEKLNHKGRTPEGKQIVSDSCLMITYGDHIELIGNPEMKTEQEALIKLDRRMPDFAGRFDEIQVDVRSETALQLTKLLHKPVVIRYQPTVPEVNVIERTFWV